MKDITKTGVVEVYVGNDGVRGHYGSYFVYLLHNKEAAGGPLWLT